MAARECGARSRRITIQVAVQRVGNVSGGPGERAPRRARELETAVDDGPVGIGEMPAEGGWLDQRRPHGGAVLPWCLARIFGVLPFFSPSRQTVTPRRIWHWRRGDTSGGRKEVYPS